jgi:hypothetical protein
MSLKLKFKRLIFRFLEFLPAKSGFWFYHQLQELLGEEDMEYKINSSHSTFKTFQAILRKNGIETKGKVIAEIGSGWLPLMPYFFKYMGMAESVKTFDLNKHYNKRKIKILNEYFSRKYMVEINKSNTGFGLPEAIHYYPNTNILNHGLINCDLVFSRFVLEHVSPQDIEAMHYKFKSKLSSGAHIIHFISPGDHRAYVDHKLSLQDFLQYSSEEWEKKQTRFDYHNRLRLPQYLEIFNKLDFEIVHLTYDTPVKNSESYRKFKNLKLHQDFLSFSEEELMAGAISIILKV